MWFQKTLILKPKKRGLHLITNEIEASLVEIGKIKIGIAHIFIKHTSASLTINENADPDVQTDMEAALTEMVPENAAYYRHVCEGADDMPAHIKCSILGSALSIPITNGRFNLGTWQGIYLCEHRNHGGSRQLIVTINGE